MARNAAKIKFCGITNALDAERAVGAGAWAIGLIFWPHSPRRCEPDVAAEIASSLKRRIEVVGVFVNPTGNPGMATAGSGDVLTGLIASLLGQKHHPLAACLPAAWLHGRAGDLAAARLGEEPLMAGDLLTCYPEALRELREGGA